MTAPTLTPPVGWQASFEAFYLDTAADTMRQVMPLTRTPAEAQDCVLHAYARACQQWNTVGCYSDPHAWVARTAHRYALSRWRKTRTRLLAHLPSQRKGVSRWINT